MINVVGANQDPGSATPATIYNFVANPKKPAVSTTPQVQEPPKSKTDSSSKSKLQALISFFKLNHTKPLQQIPAPTSETISESQQPIATPPEILSEPTKPVIKSAKSKKTFKLGWLILILVILAVGVEATIYLTQSNQDLRQQASEIEPTGKSLKVIPKVPDPTPIETTFPTDSTVKPTIKAGGLGNLLTNPPIVNDSENLNQNSESLALNNSPTATLTPEPTSESTPELTLEPTVQPTLELIALSAPKPTEKLVNTALNCNESCTTDENCFNQTHSCYQGFCRLSSNPTSSSCLLLSGSNQMVVDQTLTARTYTPNASIAGETPIAGPNNWLIYGLSGLGLLILSGLVILWL